MKLLRLGAIRLTMEEAKEANGRTTPRSSLHGFAKNEVRQEFQNQCSQGTRSRATTRKTRLQ
eukprot:11323759-Heterocapsa_arctica.AAC.1